MKYAAANTSATGSGPSICDIATAIAAALAVFPTADANLSSDGSPFFSRAT